MSLPLECYSVKQIRRLEQLAISKSKITEYQLMNRAGKAALKVLQEAYPKAQKITVFCGKGNNGGDGYVLARLAKQAGLAPTVYSLGEVTDLPPTAAQAYNDCARSKVPMFLFDENVQLIDADVAVDALLGIGARGKVEGSLLKAIHVLNAAHCPILAIDIPSGLDADRGCSLGQVVQANHTVTFIGVKQGLLTGAGIAYCGTVECDDLGLSHLIEKTNDITPTAVRIDQGYSQVLLKPRRRDAHKGDFGHVLVVGGDYGMAGAVRLAGEAAIRSGAGLVTVATRPEHVAAVVSNRPELMCYGIQKSTQLSALIQRATVIVIGPGLGKSQWSESLWQIVMESHLPMVIDASALHYLAKEPIRREHCIITPHPGEASDLLGISTAAIQQDRFEAVHKLQQRYGGVAVLKGAGTLIQSEDKPPLVCNAGNPGMATGGMGDVLSGFIAGFLAQQHPLLEAALLGVAIHAAAGDLAAINGERSLLASDLFIPLRRLIDPE